MADQPTEKPMEKPGPRWTRWTRAAAAVRTLIADIKCVSVAACCRAKYLGNLGGQKINTGGDSLESSPGFAGD